MVTTYEIAKHCGLSQPTVSRILSRGSSAGRHSAETRRRVIEAARVLGYRPNAAARAIHQGRFNAVALLMGMSPFASNVPAEMLRAVSQTLRKRDCSLSLLQLTDDDLSSEDKMPRLLRESSNDGLLVDYTHAAPAELGELIERHQIPAIWINTLREHDVVRVDDRSGGQEATRRLLERGHRRIAFLDMSYGSEDPAAHYSKHHRFQGYADVMNDAGLRPRAIEAEGRRNVPAEDRLVFCRGFLEREDRPTALVSYTSTFAGPLLLACSSLGLEVPRDLSLIGFDNALYAGLGIDIDTMVLPQYEVGQTATERLMAKIASPAQKFPAELLPLTYGHGQTIGPAD